MLNLNCIICSEIFSQTCEIVVTRCGHLFHKSCLSSWLQRSQTCPQCRSLCSNNDIHRVYFNLDAGEIPNSIDNGLVNELLDSANIQVKESERNLMKADEEIRLLTQTQQECMETISSMKKELQEQVAVTKSCENGVQLLTKEIEMWKIKSNKFESALLLEIRTRQDLEVERSNSLLVSGQLKNQLSTLKSELQKCESNRTDLSNMLKTVKDDLFKEKQLKKDTEARLVEKEKLISTLQQNENLLKEEVSTLKSELQASSLNAKTDLNSTLETVQCYLQKEIEMKRIGEELLAQIGSKLMNPSGVKEGTESSNQAEHINQRHLMWLVKEKARTAGWKFVWLKDGKVLARKEHGAKVVHIATADDISNIE